MTPILRALISFFSVILLSYTLSGCASGPTYWSYTKVDPPSHVSHPTYVPVWMDSTFTPKQVEEMRAAFKEWNYVLNGQIVIYLAESQALGIDKKMHNYPTTFTGWESGYAIEQQCQKTGLGIVVFNLPSTSKHMPKELDKGTLAFVHGEDSHSINIMTDMLGSRSLKDITMHELAHILGATHVNMTSLENPYYSRSQTNCIDKVTVAQVAHEKGLDFDTLNYCVTPHFE